MGSDFKSELTGLIPHMRAFARNLTGHATRADDLVQDALLNAWKARDSYKQDSSLRAWVFTILRNKYYSDQRRAWRSQPLEQEVAEATLVATDNAGHSLDLLTLKNAIARLPDDQREALILVGAGGVSYEEAAHICQCAIGTIKSRVSRARKSLEEILEKREVSLSDSKVAAGDAIDDIMDQAAHLQSRT